jgi:two-component system sensor histidine kinase QseC
MIFLALGVVLVVNKGLQPLIDLSQQIRERNIDKLEPLVLEKAPKELKPLGQAVNLLMEQVSQDIERERRFLGDIAHELRTPLAAMKLNAQNGLYSKDIYSIQNFLIKIVRGVDRSIRLIEQLLTLARLDPRALSEPEICILGDIAQEVVSALSPQQQSGVNISLDQSLFAVKLKAYPDLLSVMLRNLIENACRYSPEGGKILLATEPSTDHSVTFTLSDQGPGVSELQLQSLGKRFFRERPADRMGSGLGLSIVARIAELHNAHVRFNNAIPQGLIVTIVFPLN